ncbi:hypothetical protein M9H77_14971 [Catharanthus roseus]|uniref:Uncharacterized protein n=1 Tax=Catharanthus roseus TaxID=4058 RepID=A0ACC0BPU6_CATRO|nr:hypothetical protein M9H77_14971 [Catharanthus roseus]
MDFGRNKGKFERRVGGRSCLWWSRRSVVEDTLARGRDLPEIHSGEDEVDAQMDGTPSLDDEFEDALHGMYRKIQEGGGGRVFDVPSMLLSPEKYKQLWKPWRRALMVKVLGRTVTYRILEQRDYEHVLDGGPWVVMGNHLTVAKWRPSFRPMHDKIMSTLVCVRFPLTPIEFFQKDFLLHLGGLFVFHFRCWKYSHKQEFCLSQVVIREAAAEETAAQVPPSVVVAPVEDSLVGMEFRPWMIPKRFRSSTGELSGVKGAGWPGVRVAKPKVIAAQPKRKPGLRKKRTKGSGPGVDLIAARLVGLEIGPGVGLEGHNVDPHYGGCTGSGSRLE